MLELVTVQITVNLSEIYIKKEKKRIIQTSGSLNLLVKR